VFDDDAHISVVVTWSIYQRIIAAYAHPDRRRGKTMMIAIIDSLRRGVPTGLEELAQLGWTLWRRRADVLAYFDHHASQRPHRSHQRTPRSPTPQRRRSRRPAPDSLRTPPLALPS
jgi:hypothetical protein